MHGSIEAGQRASTRDTHDPRAGRRLTILDQITDMARQSGDAAALCGVDRRPMTYDSLLRQMHSVAASLEHFGLGRGDRIAAVLPNGPVSAAAFACISTKAAIAPLNPDCSSDEFSYQLSALQAAALLIERGSRSPAREIAESRHVPVIELIPDESREAGAFHLESAKTCEPGNADFAEPDDVALCLFTSGTTSRPKIVPLTHRNLCTSAANVSRTLQLTADDCCLNVMPLFHIQGLVGAVLCSLVSGGSVVCTPGFSASDFLGWVRRFRPTWYTAAPTIHQAVLAQAAAEERPLEIDSLRFIRSAASALPAQVALGLEERFSVPVIEAYGMTEAAQQISSNPLPPHVRKLRSVGPAAGPEVDVMDEQGQLVERGAPGEIVIRGDNVMRGYDGNPTANESAFVDGWFRTGDLGHLDEDGYLFLTGRKSETIIRGGENISPREIDEALLDQPQVSEAVTFPIPHETLGEDVAAAVVLQEASPPTEHGLRQALSQRLAAYKVPSRILLVDAIPKSRTGKPQRRQLHLHFAAQLKDAYVPPENSVEQTLAEIFREILGVKRIGRDDNFFVLGWDSLSAARIVSRIWDRLHVRVPIRTLFEWPTIASLSNVLMDELAQTGN